MDDRSRTPVRSLRPALPPAILGTIVLLATIPLIDTDWYTLVRYAVSILALITVVIAAQAGRWWPTSPLVIVAVLWNPAWPIELEPGVALVLHLLGAAAFIAGGVFTRVDAASR